MRKKSIILFAAMLALYSNATLAKSENKDLLKGDYLYRHLAFHEAIPHYEKATTEVNDVEVYSKLGDCYAMVKDPQNAVVWYAKAAQMKDCPADVKLRYGMALMTLQRYDEARSYIQDYQAANPENRMAANLVASCETGTNASGDAAGGIINMLPFNTDGSEFSPYVKGKELVFTSDSSVGSKKIDKWTGNPYYNIYTVSCDDNGRCKNEFNKISGKINSKYHDGSAVFNTDGTEMYFTRTNFTKQLLMNGSVPDESGVVRLQVMMATGYDSADNSFSKISSLPFNSKEYSTAHPALSADGNILMFSSDMPGGEGGSDLYISTKGEDEKWTAPVNAGKNLNTEGEEMFPYLSNDNVLYFASNGQVGLGGLDIYSSKWNNDSRMFEAPVNMGAPVNSSYDDMSLAMNANGAEGYFASSRPAEKKGDNIYFVNLRNVYLALTIKDAATGMAIPASTVLLNSGTDKRSFTTNWDGTILSKILPESQYTAQISKSGYKTQAVNVATFNAKNNDTITQEVLMESDFAIHYNAVVLDESTFQPIEDAKVVFARMGGKSADTTYLSELELFTKPLDPNAEYNVYAVKDKYYSSERMISTAGITPNMGTMKIKDTLFMKELKVGEVYKIENIYYDYNKANVREDAKPSLNRLIQMLEQYPDMKIQVNSHTDCRGADAYNTKLSKARANSVINYLQERGISKNRLMHKGFGESAPVEKCDVCDKCSEEQHQRNRRTEFQITSM